MTFINIPDPTSGCHILKQLKQEGNIVYEYNPLRVYRINEDLKDEKNNIIPKNSLVDLDTCKLEFDLEHPVDIITQQSYDGSVNLILNDGLHEPKLINTRFSTTGMNTYQIVDREGNNDSNIYDENSFESETSLYKVPNGIVKLDFIGLGENGNLKVGNYVFYFKLADADGNETDIVAESSIVSCHIGNINDPHSIRGGLEDENSFKSVSFIMSNIDSAYDHITVYYTRNSAGGDQLTSPVAYKIYEKFPIYNSIGKINITGFERAIEISIDELNMQYNIVSNAKTQTTCQNMLFLGNVTNEDIKYKELTDLSLHFTPKLCTEDNIGNVQYNYNDDTGKYEYYNALNIYNKLGYWNDEIYRFGVVYILNNYTLSPVFNVRGIKELNSDTEYSTIPVYEKKNRNFIEVDKSNYLIDVSKYETKAELPENSKGVVRIKYNKNQFTDNGVVPIGIKFTISDEAKTELQKYTKGFFFVRQKRIKTTFCQALVIGSDKTNYCPALPISDAEHFQERFLNDDRVLTHDFLQRQYKLTDVVKGASGICPEYELNQPYFNQFFSGSEFIIKKSTSNVNGNYLKYDNGRNYYPQSYTPSSDTLEYKYNIVSVPDNTQIIKCKNRLFSSRAGASEDVEKFEYCGTKDKSTNANNLIRGSFGPYIGLESLSTALDLKLIDIKIPGYNTTAMDSYFDIRYRDSSPFFAISDRISWENYNTDPVYRGDCYICNFSHRMIRNFQDIESPTNDEIVDPETWKTNYSVNEEDSQEKRLLINRGDVNAVKLGHWVTFKCCSSINLSLRTTDPYYPSEQGMTGRMRGFYPLYAMDVSGESKIPESGIHNSGYDVTTSELYKFEYPSVPAIKNKFHTRILYSNIAINDAYKNGFRTFQGINYRDYPLTYGSLVKMVEWYSNIICIFEHGIALIPVNERALASQATGGNVFINTSNVLPENPNIISNMLGTQWADSVVQTPNGIYGVDTVAKKIWKIIVYKGQCHLVTLSDFKVQSFLNKGITLSEKETTPFIGIRNVKTHYNSFKNDIMFTFYDDINTIEEKAWSLCYNEVLDKFVTFYSWIPSFSANIDNIFFTFDRNTSKNIALKNNTHKLITCSNCSVPDKLENIDGLEKIVLKNTDESEEIIYYKVGTLKRIHETGNKYTVKFELCEDLLDNKFTIKNNELYINENCINSKDVFWKVPIKSKIIINTSSDEGSTTNTSNTTDIDLGIELGLEIQDNIILYKESFLNFEKDTKFWKHGQSGLMKTKDVIKPCMWYGDQHPFEFEIIAVENPSLYKIFTDLQIISNKVAPESLHFEISGDSYNFADDMENMYFRQEATKNLYQYNGGNILYDNDYLKLTPEQRSIPYSASGLKDRSTMFPLYYSRVDTINEIEDYYQSKKEAGKDYQRMSGSEIIHDKITNQFNIATHVKGCPFGEYYKQEIDQNRYNYLIKEYGKDYPFIEMIENSENSKTKYYEIKQYGRLNGNMHYKNSLWHVQIPPIVYLQKNEEWTIKYPPLNISNSPLPEDVIEINTSKFPTNLTKLGYNKNQLNSNKWTTQKETRIRDKYIKIKVRYTGSDLAIIYALKTMFTISNT